ncbi:MAG: GumC family protein [Rhizobiaceae bacterium]|jgi:exopolysaccharide transport family protein|nr:GumC family protein [Rhizobiaceae bacterium]
MTKSQDQFTPTRDERDVDIDLAALAAAVWRRKALIGALALGLSVAAFAGSSLISPKYQSETRLLVESGESVFTQPASGGQGNGEAMRVLVDREAVLSQVEIIKSTDLLRKIATDFDLASRKEFDEAANLNIISKTLITFGLQRNPLDLPADVRVLKSMREKLEVFAIENSRVIAIRFKSKDPALAEKIPNAIADAYLGLQRDAKLATNADAAEFLQPEINALRDRVRAAEAKVAEFKSANDLLDGQNQSTLATQQLAELSSELSRVKANRGSAEATAAAMRAALSSGASLDALPSVQSSGLIDRLRERRAELGAQIAQLGTTLLDGHPRIQALRSQLADLEGQIRSEAQKVIAGLDTLADTARKREEQLVIDLNRLKAESARTGEESVELRALEREAAAERQLLESYLSRYREASARTDNAYVPADARIFSKAVTPTEPYFPKKLPITIAAFFAGLMAGVLWVLLAELFSGRAMRRSAVTAMVPMTEPVMTATAAPSSAMTVAPEPTTTQPVADPEPIIAPEPTTLLRARQRIAAPPAAPAFVVPVSQRVETVASELIAAGWQRAVFLSPEGDKGVAGSVLVTRNIADQGVRVILVDLTTTALPSRAMLESDAASGITNMLASDAAFADILHADLYSEAQIAPRGNASVAKAMRNAERLPQVLAALNAACDILVIECGAAEAAMLDLVADPDFACATVVSATQTALPLAAAMVATLGGPDTCLQVTTPVAPAKAAA